MKFYISSLIHLCLAGTALISQAAVDTACEIKKYPEQNLVVIESQVTNYRDFSSQRRCSGFYTAYRRSAINSQDSKYMANHIAAIQENDRNIDICCQQLGVQCRTDSATYEASFISNPDILVGQVNDETESGGYCTYHNKVQAYYNPNNQSAVLKTQSEFFLNGKPYCTGQECIDRDNREKAEQELQILNEKKFETRICVSRNYKELSQGTYIQRLYKWTIDLNPQLKTLQYVCENLSETEKTCFFAKYNRESKMLPIVNRVSFKAPYIEIEKLEQVAQKAIVSCRIQ